MDSDARIKRLCCAITVANLAARCHILGYQGRPAILSTKPRVQNNLQICKATFKAMPIQCQEKKTMEEVRKWFDQKLKSEKAWPSSIKGWNLNLNHCLELNNLLAGMCVHDVNTVKVSTPIALNGIGVNRLYSVQCDTHVHTLYIKTL